MTPSFVLGCVAIDENPWSEVCSTAVTAITPRWRWFAWKTRGNKLVAPPPHGMHVESAL